MADFLAARPKKLAAFLEIGRMVGIINYSKTIIDREIRFALYQRTKKSRLETIIQYGLRPIAKNLGTSPKKKIIRGQKSLIFGRV